MPEQILLPKEPLATVPATREQVAILHHTEHRAAGGYYCGGGKDMAELVEAGLMVSAGYKAFVPDEYFRITSKGREVLREAMKNQHA
jgi:hypothetical protein